MTTDKPQQRKAEAARWLKSRPARDLAAPPDLVRMWGIRILNDIADVDRMRFEDFERAAASMFALADEVDHLRRVQARHKSEITKLCEAARRRNTEEAR